MPPCTRPTLPSFLVAAAIAAPLALAQQPEGTAPPTQPTGRLSPRPPRAATEPGKLLSVEFNGGTLAQFVEAVKAASPDPINVIVPAELSRISVPAVSLKSLSPMMALQSLEFAVNRASAIGGARGIEQAGAVGQIRVVQLNTENGNNAASGSAPTFAVSYERAMTHPQHAINAASAAALSTRVFSVRELLAVKEQQDVPGLTLDQIVQPVETALSVDAGDAPGDEAPRVMVHRESNLIIVRGTQRQTELTRQVLDRLREDVEVARDRARPEADFRRAMEEITAQRAAEEATAERLMISASKQLQAAEQR
ncbi:MAG TPA: hypothetical protein VEB22_11435, partial [Phycisphaerales bacterium]|nr:hypothetical protein [Phycisphaerales bacterium]